MILQAAGVHPRASRSFADDVDQATRIRRGGNSAGRTNAPQVAVGEQVHGPRLQTGTPGGLRGGTHAGAGQNNHRAGYGVSPWRVLICESLPQAWKSCPSHTCVAKSDTYVQPTYIN